MLLPSYLYTIILLLCIEAVFTQDTGGSIKQDVTEAILNLENRLLEKMGHLLDEKISDRLEEKMDDIIFRVTQLDNSLSDVKSSQDIVIEEMNNLKADKDCTNYKSNFTSVENISSTTEGPRGSPGLDWLSVGNERFVRFEQEMNWDGARSHCRRLGLDIYQPKEILKLASFLDDNFRAGSTMRYWIGARGNGTHYVYHPSNDVLIREPGPPAAQGSRWVSDAAPDVSPRACVYLYFDSTTWERSNKKEVLLPNGCDRRASVLCG